MAEPHLTEPFLSGAPLSPSVPASPAQADHSRYVQRIRRRYAAERERFAVQHAGVP